MRIALVTYALQVGGVETFIKLLADYFQEQGHEVDLIETLTKGRWSQTFEDEGYRVIGILPDPVYSRIHHVNRIANVLSKYDAVILNDAPLAQAVLGLLPEKTIAIPVLHMFLTSMVRNAAANSNNWDALSAVSPAVKNSAIQFGVDGKRIFCIPNGIKVSDQWPKSGQDSSQGDPLHVVYIGAINHAQKGVLYLPGTMKDALTRGAMIHFEVIGAGVDMEELLKGFRRDCPGADIKIHGSLPNHEAMEILSRSDVLIMPSHFEGLPLVLLEAMARGVVPVVTRLKGCLDFVVESGINGYLVEPGYEKGFGEFLSGLYKDRRTLKSLSFSAWETIYKRFSYVKTGASYLELIENCSLQRQRGKIPKRTGVIDKTLLGDFPRLPIFLMRPVRKALRMLGLFPAPVRDPLLFGTHR
jgi:glycosyltransferase involved in cell wall biosynthesis